MAHYGYLVKRAKDNKADERADISNGPVDLTLLHQTYHGIFK